LEDNVEMVRDHNDVQATATSKFVTSLVLSDSHREATGTEGSSAAVVSMGERMSVTYPTATSLELQASAPEHSSVASGSVFSPANEQNAAEDYRQQPHMSLAAAITAGKLQSI